MAKTANDLNDAVKSLGGFDTGLYAEKWVPFERELAVMVEKRARVLYTNGAFRRRRRRRRFFFFFVVAVLLRRRSRRRRRRFAFHQTHLHLFTKNFCNFTRAETPTTAQPR